MIDVNATKYRKLVLRNSNALRRCRPARRYCAPIRRETSPDSRPLRVACREKMPRHHKISM